MGETSIIILTVLTGGAIWPIITFIYPEIKRPILNRINAKKTFYNNLNPILRSSSELYGKIESLAKEDFSTFINPANSNSKDPEHNRLYVYYLFSQFWAQLEYFRLESQQISLSKTKKGNQLLQFIETIESRKYRILDRSVQRIIGECLITQKDQRFRVITMKEFLEQLDDPDSTLSKWVNTLDQFMKEINDKEKRQIVLRFGIIVAMLIDHFDPNYKTVRRRPIYKNKLNQKSKKLIMQNLLTHYLQFIKNDWRFYI